MAVKYTGKFTRTQEKQYGAWVAFPGIGVKIPNTSLITTKETPWVLVAPNGMKLMSATELASGFLFKTLRGTTPINLNTSKARMVEGVLDWTPVVRNTANVPPVMARYVPDNFKKLGYFEVYPEAYGQQYANTIAGDVFVRMFTLHGGLSNIATPEQALGITPKPRIAISNQSPECVKQTVVLLPIPEGMPQSYGDTLTKFYAEIKTEARLRYKTEVTNGELFNSGYFGITFIVNGHKFNLCRGGVGSKLNFASTDFKEGYVLSSDIDESLAKAKAIFYSYLAKPRVKLNVGDIRDLKSKDYTKFENCVTAELLATGIILSIKKDVTTSDLLRFTGFNGDEVLFKYEGPFNTYGEHRMLVMSKDKSPWSYRWGSSTTLASEEVWSRNRVVIAAMEQLTGKIIFSK